MGFWDWILHRRAIKERMKFHEEESKDDPYWNELTEKEKRRFIDLAISNEKELKAFVKKNPGEYARVKKEADRDYDLMMKKYGLVEKTTFKKWKNKPK